MVYVLLLIIQLATLVACIVAALMLIWSDKENREDREDREAESHDL